MTVALMIGGDGAQWLSWVTKSLSREVLGSNPTGAVSNIGQVHYPTLPKSLGVLLVYPKRMAVGAKPKEEGGILKLKRFQDVFLFRSCN